MKIQKGDQVLITAGKDKGRTGTVEKVLPKIGSVLIPGVNVYKKHRKGFAGQKGSIVELSRPLTLGSVAIICSSCKKQTRVGYQILADGEKVRICKKCKRRLDTKEGK